MEVLVSGTDEHVLFGNCRSRVESEILVFVHPLRILLRNVYCDQLVSIIRRIHHAAHGRYSANDLRLHLDFIHCLPISHVNHVHSRIAASKNDIFAINQRWGSVDLLCRFVGPRLRAIFGTQRPADPIVAVDDDPRLLPIGALNQ